MAEGRGTWFRAREAGVDEQTIDRLRELRDAWYQEYLRTEAIGIEGVEETLAGLSQHVRMAIVTTSKRADFELIHERRQIVKFMDFVLVNLNPFHSFAARCSQRAARCKTAVKPHDSKGGNHLKTLQENGCVHARKSIR